MRGAWAAAMGGRLPETSQRWCRVGAALSTGAIPGCPWSTSSPTVRRTWTETPKLSTSSVAHAVAYVQRHLESSNQLFSCSAVQLFSYSAIRLFRQERDARRHKTAGRGSYPEPRTQNRQRLESVRLLPSRRLRRRADA
jgi:hypothetical protein